MCCQCQTVSDVRAEQHRIQQLSRVAVTAGLRRAGSRAGPALDSAAVRACWRRIAVAVGLAAALARGGRVVMLARAGGPAGRGQRVRQGLLALRRELGSLAGCRPPGREARQDRARARCLRHSRRCRVGSGRPGARAAGAWPCTGSATAAVVAAAVYGCVYGAAEVCGSPWPPAPGRRWQVPQDLLIGDQRTRRVLVWGCDPRARLPDPQPVRRVRHPACAGRGGRPRPSRDRGRRAGRRGARRRARGRAAARQLRPPYEPFALLLRSLRWRALDGLALLTVAGAAAVVAGFRLG